MSAAVTVKTEPLTYRADNAVPSLGGNSYFLDLIAARGPAALRSHITTTNQKSALARLNRHAAELDVEMPKIRAERARRAQQQVERAETDFRRSVGLSTRRGLDISPFESRATPDRGTGHGGYMVPPLWLQEYAPGLRAGRVAADLCRQIDLPMGTDSITLPKLSTLTLTGIQNADNAAIVSQDFTDTSVVANVKTLAGFTDISLQLLEQSPYSMDAVLLEDLMSDYNLQVDKQVIAGNGAGATSLNGGSLLGLYPSTNWTGSNTVTFTDASPAAWKFLSAVACLSSRIASNRYNLGPSVAYVVHPRRAFWFASGTDSNNRPLVEPSNVPSFNTDAVDVDALPAQGLMGRLPWGSPFYSDANVTTTDTTGGGTGQDVAIGARWDDVWLFQGEPRVDVFNEVLSGTMGVRLRIYGYVALMVRYGQSLAIATGSGFAAPAGAVSSLTF